MIVWWISRGDVWNRCLVGNRFQGMKLDFHGTKLLFHALEQKFFV